MNKTELIKAIAAKAEFTQKDTKELVDAFVDVVTEELATGEGKVSITGFGTWEVKERAERTARNPQTGEEILVPATNVPKFKAASALKAAVKGE